MSNNNCNDDNQCSNNYLCSFDEKKLNHSCKNLNQSNLYLGCMTNDFNNFDYISSNSPEHLDNFKNCMDFSRKQINKDGYYHNNFLFNKKKETSIDMSSINIYLISGIKNIANLPIQDYFNTECDIKSENCKFVAKKIFFSFIQANKTQSSEKMFLEINYECYNEVTKNKEILPIDEIKNSFSFEINCPKNKKDPKFQSQCISFYIDNQDFNKYNKINKKKLLYTCENPVYNTPRIVKDVTAYKKSVFKNNNVMINNYEKEIEQKKEELQKLEAQKYQKIHKINKNEDISMKDAMENINKLNMNSYKKGGNGGKANDIEKKWKLFNNFDALQNIIDDAQFQDSIKTYGSKVYTIEEAIKISNEENESFFVYYHNSFELDQYSSSLYFIDVYKIDNKIFDKKNWNNSNNVTTAILNFENYYDDNIDNNYGSADFKDYISNLLIYQQLMTDEMKQLNMKNVDDVNNINDIVINNLNENLNRKITTKNQGILMNQQEEKTNNYIINVLSYTLILFIILYVFIILYFNSVKKNNSN